MSSKNVKVELTVKFEYDIATEACLDDLVNEMTKKGQNINGWTILEEFREHVPLFNGEIEASLSWFDSRVEQISATIVPEES